MQHRDEAERVQVAHVVVDVERERDIAARDHVLERADPSTAHHGQVAFGSQHSGHPAVQAHDADPVPLVESLQRAVPLPQLVQIADDVREIDHHCERQRGAAQRFVVAEAVRIALGQQPPLPDEPPTRPAQPAGQPRAHRPAPGAGAGKRRRVRMRPPDSADVWRSERVRAPHTGRRSLSGGTGDAWVHHGRGAPAFWRSAQAGPVESGDPG